MERVIRRKLDMATRARDFCRANPGTAATFADVLGKLDEQLARAQSLAEQEVSGRNTERVSSGARVDLQQSLLESPLKDILRVASSATDQPELGRLFRLPRQKANRQAFITRARVIAADAAKYKALFVAHGLADTFVEDLNAALDSYAAAVTGVHSGTEAHTGARKELRVVAAEVLNLVHRLDAMNRIRFKAEPKQLAAWESACDIAWPVPQVKAEEKKAGGETRAA